MTYYKHIYTCPYQHGIRSAVSYRHLKLKKITMGYFLGYVGGGIQQDGFFTISDDAVDIHDTKPPCVFYDMCREDVLKGANISEFGEVKFPKDYLKENFQNFGKSWYYEDKGFNGNILTRLSQKWPLLCSYTKNKKPINDFEVGFKWN